MISKFVAAAFVAGLVNPAAAATLDFTADDATGGSVVGTTWTVTAGPGSLAYSTHGNNAGCSGYGWESACAAAGDRFDVGFGVTGQNNNEIDGVRFDEYVEIAFGKVVKVTGFAGMLAYANEFLGDGGDGDQRVAFDPDREQVILEYRIGVGAWASVIADPLFIIEQFGNGSFDTVGLAYLDGLSLFADAVRFRAGGVGDADDGSFNVTAAGLQVSAVPVPAGLPLLLTGLGALVLGARRKKRNAA